MKLIKYFGLAITAITLVACSGKQNLDYLKSINSKQLVIKAPLSSTQIDNRYVLPNIGKITPASIEPPINKS